MGAFKVYTECIKVDNWQILEVETRSQTLPPIRWHLPGLIYSLHLFDIFSKLIQAPKLKVLKGGQNLRSSVLGGDGVEGTMYFVGVAHSWRIYAIRSDTIQYGKIRYMRHALISIQRTLCTPSQYFLMLIAQFKIQIVKLNFTQIKAISNCSNLST